MASEKKKETASAKKKAAVRKAGAAPKRNIKAKKIPAKKQKSKSQSRKAAVKTSPTVSIVGIGASAGGLEAFEMFFKNMPKNSGLAFVLVAHLDPGHASILPEIIQKKTEMKVQQVKDNMSVKPNNVYIIPPNREMGIINGSLQLLKMSQPRGANLPIDVFFRSLAQDQGNNAIGIIFSGTGTDGTLGVRAIKGEGGMVMVQDVESARYDGMPRSAIATGLADYILSPVSMPRQLLNYTSHVSRKSESRESFDDDTFVSALQKIFLLLRVSTDHDFSKYKKNTICRRIERRMHVHQVDNISDYLLYLQKSEREITILFKDLLIGVTNFFRDPDAFNLLQKKYLPILFKDKPEDYSVRIWVPGCSSGEEVYSIAILMQECMATMNRHFNVQIFGTDIDEDAINVARAGLYPESITADVEPGRLKKFFTKEENQYQIKKNIRETVVFALQNIIKDPPFTKLDLLCCRNLLIYFGPELQKKLLPVFHYSLKKDGILFLGSSETIGTHTDLFTMQEKKWKIFRRRPNAHSVHRVMEFKAPVQDILPPVKEFPAQLKKSRQIDSLKLVKSILQQSEMSPCVIIDVQSNIIYVHGRTGRYLEPAEGEASVNIIEMARPGLKAFLNKAINKMLTDRREAVIKDIPIKEYGEIINVTLIVRPLPDQQAGLRGLMMVIFEESIPSKGSGAGKLKQVKKKGKIVEVSKLEDELQFTRESLQTTIEEMETANEELKSTNEELQSTNEELQSTNEELETSKEELQSLNEESVTVNAELQSRIDELSQANDDIKNLLDATHIACIFLDVDMCVRRFTPKSTELFPLTLNDIGRPIKHFTSNLKKVSLDLQAKKVLDDLKIRELEVYTDNGDCYRMLVRPYRTQNNVIDGVVITFADITVLKKQANELAETKNSRRLATVINDSNDAVTLQDLDGNIIAWNKGARKMLGYTKSEALKMNIRDMVPANKKNEAKRLIGKLIKNEVMIPFETQRKTKDGRTVDIILTVTKIVDNKGVITGVATTERDTTRYNDLLAELDRLNK